MNKKGERERRVSIHPTTPKRRDREGLGLDRHPIPPPARTYRHIIESVMAERSRGQIRRLGAKAGSVVEVDCSKYLFCLTRSHDFALSPFGAEVTGISQR